jgi:predicted enzyme related to lactoylglutathione lyase
MGVEVRAPLGVGIVSPDPERLLAFYAECLGFETLRPLVFPTGTVHRLRAGGSLLRVYEPSDTEPADVPTDSFAAARGFRYMTLVVDDVQAVLDACRVFGLDVPDAPNEIAQGAFMALVQDPEGNWMELQSR